MHRLKSMMNCLFRRLRTELTMLLNNLIQTNHRQAKLNNDMLQKKNKMSNKTNKLSWIPKLKT